MKPIRISTVALRKNGTARYVGNRPVWAKVLCQPVERNGAWAVTPRYSSITRRFIKGEYVVTHVLTGAAVLTDPCSLRFARKVMEACAALPQQSRWRRLRNRTHMTRQMQEAGRELRDRLLEELYS